MVYKFMNIFNSKWSFAICGAILAAMFLLGFYIFGTTIGLGDGMRAMSEYFSESMSGADPSEVPEFDWQIGIFLGMFIGALGASLMNNSWKLEFILQEGGQSVGAKLLYTMTTGLLGGFFGMMGMQLAGDSIFGLMGSALQLASGAWVYLITFFVLGVIFSILMERRREG